MKHDIQWIEEKETNTCGTSGRSSGSLMHFLVPLYKEGSLNFGGDVFWRTKSELLKCSFRSHTFSSMITWFDSDTGVQTTA